MASRTCPVGPRARALRMVVTAAVVWSIAVMVSPVFVAAANSGDFAGNDVTYTDLSEGGTGAPLFGTPTVSGNSLDFNPVGYSASSSNGGTGSAIGNLVFGIEVNKKSSSRIGSILLSEAGTTTLSGNVAPGSMGTASAVFASGVLDIHEVNFEGINHISVPFSMTFNPSGGTYFLGTDGGGGPLFNTQFAGSVTLPVDQILIANGLAAAATKVSIDLSNELHAVSEPLTSAFMAKLDFGVNTVVHTPEPTVLPALALAGLALARRRRRTQLAA